MRPQDGNAAELRVLVLAPVGRDAEVTCAVLISSVHNAGAGIPPEEQPLLFAHGGRLELSSTAEAGTTFTIRLPLDARASQQVEADGGET